MDDMIPLQHRGVAPKPPTPPKPKGLGRIPSRTPQSSSREEATEGMNGQQRGQEAAPVPKARTRPIPAKRTSLAKRQMAPTSPPDGDTKNPASSEMVIMEVTPEQQKVNLNVPNDQTTQPWRAQQPSGEVDASLRQCTTVIPQAEEVLPADTGPREPEIPQETSRNKHHKFTIIKVAKPGPITANKALASETGAAEPKEVPGDAQTEIQETEPTLPTPLTPPSVPPRQSPIPAPDDATEVFHRTCRSDSTEGRRGIRNPSYEKALDSNEIDCVVTSPESSQHGFDAPGREQDTKPEFSSRLDSEKPVEEDVVAAVKPISKSITVEVISKLAEPVDEGTEDGKVDGQVAHSNSEHEIAASSDTPVSLRPFPARKAPPPPKPRPKVEKRLGMEVKTEAVETVRSASCDEVVKSCATEGYVEMGKQKSRSTFYDDDYAYVDVPEDRTKTKKADRKSKRKTSGNFYDYIFSRPKVKDTKKEDKVEAKGKRKSSESSKLSLPRRKSTSSADRQSSVFYCEIDDLVQTENSRRHSEHIYQNYSDGECVEATHNVCKLAASGTDGVPTPPPRSKRTARKGPGKHNSKPTEMSTDDDGGECDHEYVYPNDPCLESIRPQKRDCPPALPARSRSCAADLSKAHRHKPAPPPVRHHSEKPASEEDDSGSPPPLPPKSSKMTSKGVPSLAKFPDCKTEEGCRAEPSQTPCDVKDLSEEMPQASLGQHHASSSTSSDSDLDDVYIYPQPAFPPPDVPSPADEQSTVKYKDSGISVNGPPLLRVLSTSQTQSQGADDPKQTPPEAPRRPKSWTQCRDPEIYVNISGMDPARTLTRDDGTLLKSSSCSDLESSTEVHYVPMHHTEHKRVSQSASMPDFHGKKIKRNTSDLSAADSVFSTESSCTGSEVGSEISEEDDVDVGENAIYQPRVRKSKAFYIAKEIMTSEQTFVRVLRLINVDFRRKVADVSRLLNRPIIPPAILNSILRYLPQLQNFNEDLLHDLKKRIDNWDNNPKIADIFVRKGPFLKLYTGYIREFESMSATLVDAKKRYPEFEGVVRQFEASSKCASLALKHYMLKPVQRIPQYRLLLTDYKKHLSEDSPDRVHIDTALAIVSEVADHANQSMKYGDNVQKLLEIQQSLIGQFEVIKPGRCLLKEGILMKLSRKEMQPRKFILLNDVLLYTTPVSSASYKLNNVLPLTGMRVCLPTKEDFQNEFSIISTQRSFTISAKTAEEREEWLAVLEAAIKDNMLKRSTFNVRRLQDPSLVSIDIEKDFKLGSKAPVWIPDARVSMCQLCTAGFTRTFRRHHCRACGKVVCGYCSDCRAPLRYLMYRPARVCMECFEVLSKDVEQMADSTAMEKQSESAFSKDSIIARFKGVRLGSFGRGTHAKQRPAVLQEVAANEENADMSGYLKVWKNKKWKKMWFVVKDKALFTFKASEDLAAKESLVLLGYEVSSYTTIHPVQYANFIRILLTQAFN